MGPIAVFGGAGGGRSLFGMNPRPKNVETKLVVDDVAVPLTG